MKLVQELNKNTNIEEEKQFGKEILFGSKAEILDHIVQKAAKMHAERAIQR